MAKDRSAEYAKALDDLEGMHARGEVSQGTYEVQRAKLLKEAAKPKRSTLTTVVLTLVMILLLFVLLRVIGFIINVSNGTL